MYQRFHHHQQVASKTGLYQISGGFYRTGGLQSYQWYLMSQRFASKTKSKVLIPVCWVWGCSVIVYDKCELCDTHHSVCGVHPKEYDQVPAEATSETRWIQHQTYMACDCRKGLLDKLKKFRIWKTVSKDKKVKIEQVLGIARS